MADQPSRPGIVPESDHGRIDRAGMTGVVAPPDPPIAPAIADAEAGGATSYAAQRDAAPTMGSRTPNAYEPADTSVPVARSGMSLIWVAAIVIVGIVLFMLWGGS